MASESQAQHPTIMAENNEPDSSASASVEDVKLAPEILSNAEILNRVRKLSAGAQSALRVTKRNIERLVDEEEELVKVKKTLQELLKQLDKETPAIYLLTDCAYKFLSLEIKMPDRGDIDVGNENLSTQKTENDKKANSHVEFKKGTGLEHSEGDLKGDFENKKTDSKHSEANFKGGADLEKEKNVEPHLEIKETVDCHLEIEKNAELPLEIEVNDDQHLEIEQNSDNRLEIEEKANHHLQMELNAERHLEMEENAELYLEMKKKTEAPMIQTKNAIDCVNMKRKMESKMDEESGSKIYIPETESQRRGRSDSGMDTLGDSDYQCDTETDYEQ